MKKAILIALMLLAVCSYAVYSVNEIVAPADNISWTIEGPAGDSEIGNSSDIFTKISESKAVFLFLGQIG